MSACICTTPAAPRWSTPTARSKRASPVSTRPSGGSAARRSPRAREATSPPRTSSTCATTSASPPASTSQPCWPYRPGWPSWWATPYRRALPPPAPGGRRNALVRDLQPLPQPQLARHRRHLPLVRADGGRRQVGRHGAREGAVALQAASGGRGGLPGLACHPDDRLVDLTAPVRSAG